ncbi:glycosyltransferase [Mangrovibacterium diazotrophicum]|uniref:Cellulose synthase/poly-beta-1,6-N-acetylglucosamine synthase-like glycosyltransferase n=1 Tax=Mangrovibacterium diazotrophicum TaxID=1261403 RepID=A0A419WBE5_9BACT|nr:glycosyltransferase [Mangrovibacterium diazotrophicum]RKD92778.1 cellulose synthase/poly-beta-1,6-N-acetylglucosamine synthase-like glycosyltransferase [Mangrovibacterium diazotrophicum]
MTQEFFNRPFYEWGGYLILLLGFVLTLVIQLVFYRRVIVANRAPSKSRAERPISVLLNVRNESERLEQFLLKLLDQNYSNFEIVVVDDFSADSTLIILGVMAKKYPKIKFSSLNQENRSSEKMAMNLAMKAAKNDWVLLLTPETNLDDRDYLAKMNQELDDDSQMLVSYVNYNSGKTRYNRLCRVERMDAFWRASANQRASIPLLYQQINVLFNKRLYFETGGFKGKMNAHYAGLELVFNQLSKLNVKFSTAIQASLREDRVTDKDEFQDLVKKHIRIFNDISFSKKWLAWLERLAKLLFLTGLLTLLFTDIRYWYVFVPVPFIAIIIQAVLIKSLLKCLAEKKIFLSSFVYVFVRPFLYFYYRASIYLQVQRNKWN